MKLIKTFRFLHLIPGLLIAYAFINQSCEADKNRDQNSKHVTTQENDPVTYLNTYSKIIITLTGISDTVMVNKKEYYLDELGRVYKNYYFNYSNPQYNYMDSNVYDSNNKLFEQYRNNIQFKRYFWTPDSVTILLVSQGYKTKIYFTGQQITSFRTSDGRYRSFKFINDNLFSVSGESSLITEYLDYENEILNPDYYLKSLEWNYTMDLYHPISKNIFLKQKDQPIHGDDFSVPEQTYNYYYEFDTGNRVTSVTDELTRIYKIHYEYFK